MGSRKEGRYADGTGRKKARKWTRKEGKKEGRINHGMHTKQSGMASSWKESEKWMHKKTDGRKRIDDRKEEWENGRVKKKKKRRRRH